MRKIIISAVAVMIGASVNAAQADWGTWNYDIAPIAEGASIADNCWGFDLNSLSQDQFIDLFKDGYKDWGIYGTAGSWNGDGTVSGTITGYGNLEEVKVWFALFDTEGNVLVSDIGSDTTGGAGQAAYPAPTYDTSAGIFDAKATNYSASGSGWYTTPEPTSGLLLLLGLGVMALRRKRA